VIRVYLIRHGQTVSNSEGRYQGQTDSTLTPLGHAQADQLSRALASVPLRAVYSSVLSRAWHTALAIAAPHDLAVSPVGDLREIGLGVWEGLTEVEVAQRFGDMVARRRRDPEGVVPPGGESLSQVRSRVLRVMREILDRHEGETVAIVAHGAVNKMVLLDAINAPLSSYWRIRQDNAAINIVEFGGSQPRVRLLNGTAHLAG